MAPALAGDTTVARCPRAHIFINDSGVTRISCGATDEVRATCGCATPCPTAMSRPAGSSPVFALAVAVTKAALLSRQFPRDHVDFA
jgi:hypothetical protein